MDNQITKTVKALPSQPIWSNTRLDLGFWAEQWQKLYELMAIYQHNAVVHTCIDINASGIVLGKPALLRPVNEGAKNLQPRKLKRLSPKRAKTLHRQWHDRSLTRKDIGDGMELVEVESHPYWDALNNDVDGNGLHELDRLISISLDVYGVGFVQKIRDYPGAKPTAYQYLPTYNMMPNRDTTGAVISWYYTTSFGGVLTVKAELFPEDLLIFRWASPVDSRASGDSALMSVLRQIELSGKWLDWQNWLVGNRARPDWLFIPKIPDGGTLSPEQVDKTEKKINDKFRGPGNGRVKVADSAGAAIPLNFSPTDMAPLAFDEQLSKAAMFAFKTPEAFSNNDGNRANLEGSLEQWARQALAPKVCLIEAVFNKEAADWDPNIIFAFENVIPEDEAFELEQEKFELQKWQVGLQYGGLKDDNYRVEVLHLDPMTPEEKEAAKPPAPVLPAPPAEKEPTPVPPAADDEKSLDLLLLNRAVANRELDRATAINLVARFYKIEDEDAKKLVTHPKAKAKIKPLPPIPVPSHLPLTDLVQMQMARQEHHYLSQITGAKSTDDIETKADGDGLPKKFTKLEDWDAEDMSLYKPYIHTTMTETANGRKKALVRLGAEEGDFGVIPSEIDKATAKATLNFCEETNQTTENNLNEALADLRDAIKNNAVEGDPVSALSARVRNIFENMDASKADEIAQTESNRAAHEGQRIAAKASGVVKGFKLLLSDDSCPLCQSFDGKEVGLDEQFNPNDYDDSILPIHPNCRCTMQEIIELPD